MYRFIPLRRTLALFVLVGLVLSLAGCSNAVSWDDESREAGTIEIEGTVRYLQLEGGFWAIEGTDETTYNPVNLPETYRDDGLKVRVQAVVRDDLASIHMVGPIIEIQAIEKR